MTTLLLVGGDSDFSQDIATLLALNGFAIVGNVAHGAASVAAVQQLQPNVVLLLSTRYLDDGDGSQTILALRRMAPQTMVVVWSARNDPKYTSAALQAGVYAYVVKTPPYEDFVHILHAILRGDVAGLLVP
jgi:DNA-binding NarL/FixJ family response regulator